MGVSKNATKNLLLRKTEEQPLRDVVLPPEVRPHFAVLWLLQGVLSRKEVSGQRLVVRTLRRVNQLSNHERLLGLVVPHPPEELVLVDEGQLGPSGVHQDLVHHHVGDLGVLNKGHR